MQLAYVEELLKNGNVTLKAKTRENLAEMVNDIPSDVKYCAGAVGKNVEELNTNSVFVVKYAECLRSALGNGNWAAGNVVILVYGEATLG